MQTLFFTVKEWNRFTWSIQEVICKKYDVILTDYKTRKEKTLLLLKINMKNFNKGMDTFNKSLNKFSKTVDSLTASASKSSFTGFNLHHQCFYLLGKTGFSKDAVWGKPKEDTYSSIWGKPIRLTGSPVSIWPEKQSQSKDQKTDTEIW